MIKRVYNICQIVLFLSLLFSINGVKAAEQDDLFTIARLKYSGGGDWYNNPSMVPNLLSFITQNTGMETASDEVQVSIMDENFFSYPVLFMTGHGRVRFTPEEVARLRTYLINGGFLLADDDYGMEEHFTREMKRVFPEKELLPVPFDHEIFNTHFKFTNGLPKIHEFDGGPPASFAYFHEGRMVVFYSSNTNISDGWADSNVHGDPENVRQLALQAGLNIILYAITH